MVSRKQKKSYKGQNVTDKIEFVVVVVYWKWEDNAPQIVIGMRNV